MKTLYFLISLFWLSTLGVWFYKLLVGWRRWWWGLWWRRRWRSWYFRQLRQGRSRFWRWWLWRRWRRRLWWKQIWQQITLGQTDAYLTKPKRRSTRFWPNAWQIGKRISAMPATCAIFLKKSSLIKPNVFRVMAWKTKKASPFSAPKIFMSE